MPSLRGLQSAFSKLQRLIAESRISGRQPFEAPVGLAFRDGTGKITQGRARCLDISEHGARIAYSQSVVLPAVMQLRFESHGVVKTGRARHCRAYGSHYEIGIEFLNPAELRLLAKKINTRTGAAARAIQKKGRASFSEARLF